MGLANAGRNGRRAATSGGLSGTAAAPRPMPQTWRMSEWRDKLPRDASIASLYAPRLPLKVC